MTPGSQEAAIGKFADKLVTLAAKHPASGVLRELYKGEAREFLRQVLLAVLEEASK